MVSQKLLITIDVTNFSSLEEGQFESFLSVIASVLVSYHNRGIDVGVATNGLNVEGQPITFIQATRHLTPSLDVFAKLSTANRIK